MSELTPNKIFTLYQGGKIDTNTAIEYLRSFIENSEFWQLRIESLKFLEKLVINNDDNFKFLENLVVSDKNDSIRALSAKIIVKFYLEKSEKIIDWIIKHDNLSSKGLYEIYRKLRKEKSTLSKSLKRSIELKAGIWYKKSFNLNNKESFRLEILNRAIRKNMEMIAGPSDYISQYRFGADGPFIKIVNNHVVGLKIVGIADELDANYFEFFPYLEDLELIGGILNDFTKLTNLKRLKVSGDDHPLLGRITLLIGLNNMINLEELDLSYNEISLIEGLENLKNLKTLILRKNHLSSLSEKGLGVIRGLDTLIRLKNLRYLDLSENFISKTDGLEKLTTLKRLDLRFQNQDYEGNKLNLDQIERLRNLLANVTIEY